MSAIAIRKEMSAERMTDLIEDMIEMHGESDFQTYLHALRFNHCNPVDTRYLDNEITKAVNQLLDSYTLTNHEFAELIKFHKLRGGKIGNLLDEFVILRDPRLCCALLKEVENTSSQHINPLSKLGYWLLIRERLQPKLARLQKHGLPEEARRHYGRQWNVVGGGSSGGLVVRLGEDLRSPSLNSRLAAGAVVKELNTAGTRIHYERVSGSGPMYGWVSIKAQGSTLLELLGASDPADEGGGDGKARPERRKSGSSARRTKTPPCAAGEEGDDRRRAERRKHSVWDPTEAPPPFGDDSEDEADGRTGAEQPKRGAMAGRKEDPDSSRCERKRVSFEDEAPPRTEDTDPRMPFSSEASTAAPEGSPHFSSTSDDGCSDSEGAEEV